MSNSHHHNPSQSDPHHSLISHIIRNTDQQQSYTHTPQNIPYSSLLPPASSPSATPTTTVTPTPTLASVSSPLHNTLLHQSAMPISSMHPFPPVPTPPSSNSIHFSETHHQPPNSTYINNPHSNPPIHPTIAHPTILSQASSDTKPQSLTQSPDHHAPPHRIIHSAQPSLSHPSHLSFQSRPSSHTPPLPQSLLNSHSPNRTSTLPSSLQHSLNIVSQHQQDHSHHHPRHLQNHPSQSTQHQFHHSHHRMPHDHAQDHPQDHPQDHQQDHHQLSQHHYSMHPESNLTSPNPHNNVTRLPHSSDHTKTPEQHIAHASAPFPNMSKIQHSPLHPPDHYRLNVATGLMFQHANRPAFKSEPIPAMQLPVHHQNPVNSFQPNHDINEPDRPFTFGRHTYFDELTHDDTQPSGALPPPAPTHPSHPHDPDVQNPLAQSLDAASALHPQMAATMLPPSSNISNLPLPNIAGAQVQGSHLHSASAFGSASAYPNATYSAGAPSNIVDAISDDRRIMAFQRKMRPMARTRAPQMTESERKQRHNEHTRASRSRIDKGLERLKAVIKKVRPQQKVNKKADVLHEAVRLLKEGFHLPRTESDDERDEQQESSLSM